MNKEEILRDQLVALLHSESHMSFMDAIKDFPKEQINTMPKNVEYTFWHILEHIRITQWDIVDFVRNSHYKEIPWPDAYWPKKEKKATWDEWRSTITSIEKDMQEMIAIVKNPKTDLFSKIPHGQGQTILREATLIADHNSYHIGEFAILRQVEKTW